MAYPFRSRLIKACDYKDVDIRGFCMPFVPDEEQLEEDLLSFRKKYVRLEDAPSAADGDIVLIACRSEDGGPKFNRPDLTVNVGAGLYSREVEAALIGMNAGDTKWTEAEGFSVEVTLKKVKRRVLPELTDELVRSSAAAVSTVSELRQSLTDKQLDEHLTSLAEGASEHIQASVIAGSEFAVDESELAEARLSGEKMARENCAAGGIDLDSLTAGEAEELFGCTREEYLSYIADIFERDVYVALLGYDLLTGEGREFSQREYEAVLSENAVLAGMPREELAKQFTFRAFVSQICSEYYCDTVTEYAYKRIEEEIR